MSQPNVPLSLLPIEYSLIEGKWWTNTIPIDSASQNGVISIAQLVVEGKLKEVLTHPSVIPLFKSDDGRSSGSQEETTWSVESHLDIQYAPFESEEENELVRLSIGVACLHAFVQVNWVGPDLDITPAALFLKEGEDLAVLEDSLNRRTISSLAFGGEPAYHLAKVTTFLRIAQILFGLQYRHCKSIPWWTLRASALHQKLLDEPVALPQSFFEQFDSLPKDLQLESHPDLTGRLMVEIGLLRHVFSQDKLAAEKFLEAARVMQLKYLLTGAMGKRTKFQETDLSQLVLLAESRMRDGDGVKAEKPVEDGQRQRNLPETLALKDDTLLEHTEFTSSSAGKHSVDGDLSHIDPASQPPLDQLDQCVFLAMCLNVKNTSPAHGLTSEQMTPYVSRVISHPKNWSIHTMTLLLRSRLEANRTRTVERSTLQLQALLDQMPTADSSLPERLQYFHSIPLPSKWEMEKELALRFLSLGVVRSAMEIFERLEMWEEVVRCWQSLERPDKGIEIVKDLLKGDKEESEVVVTRMKENSGSERRPALDSAREAKLWCLLGDLEPQNAAEHYQHAWDVSKGTSGRAMRSLGGYHFARGNFEQANVCLKRAVEINPLQNRSWFILGCSLVRSESWEAARDAFARCVALDDDDGESWNNLASVYLKIGEKGVSETQYAQPDVSESNADPQSMAFSSKYLAFRALKQGLRFRYDNWRMWSNYMIVAMDVGELGEACRALGRVVEECAEKMGETCVDLEVLERLVDAVTRGNQDDLPGSQQNSNSLQGLGRQVMDLFTRVILPRLSSSPRIFRAYGRLLIWQGSWSAALEAHMNAYRASVASDTKVETDLARWKEAVTEVEDLVDVLRNLGPRIASETTNRSEGGRKGTSWQFQARGVVRTFMGRTRDAFEHESEWTKLTELLESLRQ
ncbi:hypothetical protein FRC02_004777 [Tulasnella sp. 418]|nr:hypothetical protein FRC02_004777 [Tulasnella sp. 418]